MKGKNGSIRTSLILLCMGIIILCTVGVNVITFFGMKNVIAKTNQNYEEAVMSGYKTQIKDEVKAMLTVIDMEYQKAAAGEIREEQAKSNAIDIIRNTRYGDDNEGYFWIDDKDGVLIMHPILSEQEGTNRIDLEDQNGVKILQNILSVADEGGYNEFYFTKADGVTVAPKIAYSEKFTPWGWIITTGNYIDSLEETIATNANEMHTMQRTMMIQGIVMSVVIMLLAIFICMYYANSMKKNLVSMQKLAERIALGDLTQEISTKRKDELGRLSVILNSAQEGIRGLVSSAGTSARELEMTQQKFITNFDTMDEAINNLTLAMNEIAENVSRQAASTSDATEGMKVIAENINVATKEMERLHVNAQEMKKCAQTSMSSMKNLFEVNKHTMENIQSMYQQTEYTNESVNKISQAASLISQIASQTNLLSLNASIEAARAGEAGRGFAVVAGEIGELATESAGTAQEINAIIQELTQNSQKSVEIMADMNTVSKEQMDTAKSTQEIFTQLSEQLEECMKRISTISKDMQEVAEQKEKVLANVETLNELSACNAASTQETSATSVEIESAVKSSVEILDDVKKHTEELLEGVSHFSV